MRLEYHLFAVVLLSFEHGVALWRLLQRQAMRDDHGRIYVAVDDALEEGLNVPLDVALPRLNRQRRFHQRPHGEFIDKPRVSPDSRHDTAVTTRHNRFPEGD